MKKIKKMRNKLFPILLIVLLITQILGGVLLAPPIEEIQATTNSWAFTTAGNYTFDSDKIEISSGQAQLKTTSTPDWYNTDWGYRKNITIDHTKVDANLSDFPVLINSSSTDLASHAQSDGDDILFTASNGTTKLNHEIERFASSTGELVAHIKIPSLSSIIDTEIYMYYGNASATNQQNATSVWDSNFKMVQHLGQLDSSGGAIQNITGLYSGTSGNYGGEGIARVGDYLYLVAGTYAKVEKINLTTFSRESPLDLSGNGYAGAECIDTDGTYLYLGEWTSPAEITRVRISDFSYVDTLTLAGGENLPAGVHIIGTDLYLGLWTSPGKVVKIDLTNFTKTATLTFNSGENHAEESDNDGTYLYVPCEGSNHIVKVQLSNFTRVSSTQLEAGETQPQECLVDGDYVYTVCRVVSDGNSIGKLVRIPLADFDRTSGSVIDTIMGSNTIVKGGDYLYLGGFYSTPAVAKIDPASFTQIGSATLFGGGGWGEGLVYYDEYIYIQSRNSGNTDGYLYKVDDSLVVSSPSVPEDSTSNGNDGIKKGIGEPTQADGKIGKAQSFDGTDDYVDLGNIGLADSTATTISMWVKVGTYENAKFFSNEVSGWSRDVWFRSQVKSDSSNGFTFTLQTVTTDGEYDIEYATSSSSWQYVVGTFLGNTIKLYVDGVERDSVTNANMNGIFVNNKSAIGSQMYDGSPNIYFDGIIDEVQISDTARSAEWISTSYNNQNSPSTFYSAGSEVTLCNIIDPAIQPTATNSQTFTSLSGFTETATKNGGEIKYQISNDAGTTWYWYNSGWTTTSSGYAETSIASVINTNIASFPVGSGEFLFKAYLHSDGTQLVQLDSINLTYVNDTTSPAVFDLSSPSDNSYTNDNTPTLSWNASSDLESGLSHYQLYIDGSLDTNNIDSLTVFTIPDGTLVDGSYTWYIKAIDNAGNERQSTSTRTINIDTVSSFATFDSGAPADPINQNTTDITVAGTDVTHYKYKLDNGSYGSETAIATHLALSNLTDGEHTIYLIGKDTAGNWQTEGSATTHTWTVDVTSPVISLSTPTNNSSTGDSTPTLTWSGSDATSGIAKYQLYIDSVLDTDNISNSATSATSTNSLSCGDHTWYVRAYDNVDNYTNSSTFNLTMACGSGLPPSAFNSPALPEPTSENPEGGFGVLINNDDEYTDSQTVNLKLNAGSDTKRMAISNTEDFEYASQVLYEEEIEWDLSSGRNKALPCSYGANTVYVKFYTQYGVASEVVSDSIILKSATTETEGQTEDPESSNDSESEEESKPETEEDKNSESSKDTEPDKTNPSGSSSFVFTKSLRLGSQGTEVTHLQNKLKELNFFSKEIESNNNFDLTTEQAVKEYQTSKGIYPCGIVGPRTRKALNNEEFITNKDYKFTKDLKYNDKSEEVKQLQTRLRDQNFFPYYLQSSGWFGSTTQKAVNIFQKFYNLIQSGVVDEGMRGVLNR